MSNFLLVIPEGWTQLDWQFVTNNIADMGEGNVSSWIKTGQLSYIEEALKAGELIPADSTVVEAKLIDDSYFMVLLG